MDPKMKDKQHKQH